MLRWVGCLLLFVCWFPGEGAAAPKRAELTLFPVACGKTGCMMEGVVVRYSSLLRFRQKASKIRSFARAVRRLTRGGLAYAWVDVAFRGKTKRVRADKYGFFAARFGAVGPRVAARRQLQCWTKAKTVWGACPRLRRASRPASRPSTRTASRPVVAKGVEEVRVSLVEAFGRWPLRRRYTASPKRSPVVFPTSSQGVSVISDIDDTLIATHVRKKTKLLKTFLFRRFDQIKVFPGALRVLRLLLKSPGGQGGGALHYVTGSPASIADRLLRLFRFRSFPMGSMHMKRLRGPQAAGATKQLAYKLGHIRRIFKRYPTRRFVLIGDNGEKDPEVYRQARQEFPRQVAAILIHNVAGEPVSTRYRGIVLFSSYADAEKELRRLRLLQ